MGYWKGILYQWKYFGIALILTNKDSKATDSVQAECKAKHEVTSEV